MMATIPRRVVSAVFVCNGKVFLCLEWSASAKGDFWFTPGGKIEDGEEDLVALQRELKEELGLTDAIMRGMNFRKYFSQNVPWGGRMLDLTHFLIRVEEEFPFQLLAGQKDSGWFASSPNGSVPEQIEVLFLRLRLDGLLPRT